MAHLKNQQVLHIFMLLFFTYLKTMMFVIPIGITVASSGNNPHHLGPQIIL